jgi:hypothetical protein
MSLRTSIVIAFGAAALLGSCASTQGQEARSPKAQKELDEALAGRTAGAPVNCLPNWRSNDMQIIDDYTILFRDGGTVYVQNPRGGCSGLGSGRYTLVTRQFGTSQLCSGDINRVVDLSTGMGGGSCVFSPFIPYTKAN